jgi:hypothetical protein
MAGNPIGDLTADDFEYPLYSATDAFESLDEQRGPVYGLPTTFLIAEDGRVCEVITGLRSEQFFDELLSRYTSGWRSLGRMA